MKVEIRTPAEIVRDAKKEMLKEVEKIMISLAYQKVNGKLKRVNINHLDVIKRLRNQKQGEEENV